MNTRHIDTATECIVSLQAEELARIHGAARVHVARGLLWLTLDGELDDHMLQAGESFTIERGMHGLMQALNAPANVVIVDASPSLSPSMPRRAAAAVLGATHRFATRRAAAIEPCESMPS